MGRALSLPRGVLVLLSVAGWWCRWPGCAARFAMRPLSYARAALGVALTAIPCPRWQLAVPLPGPSTCRQMRCWSC